MIKTTKWRPDTCDCEIEYTWDDSVTQENRVHTDKSIIKCQHHTSLSDTNAQSKVKIENTQKNIAHGHILKTFPGLTQEVTDKDGNVLKEFKPGIKYEWSFDANRELVIDIIGADQKTKDDVLASVKTKLNNPNIKLK